jgi:hypothetical protein
MQASCYCEIRQKKNVSRCAVMGKEGYGQREGRGTSVTPESNGIDSGDLRVVDEKFIGLERSFAKEKKGEDRGGPGPFIATRFLAGGDRVSAGGGDRTVADAGMLGLDTDPRRNKTDAWALRVSEGDGVSHTVSIRTRDGPWAGFKAGLKSFPTAFSSFFISFPFLFFDF